MLPRTALPGNRSRICNEAQFTYPGLSPLFERWPLTSRGFPLSARRGEREEFRAADASGDDFLECHGLAEQRDGVNVAAPSAAASAPRAAATRPAARFPAAGAGRSPPAPALALQDLLRLAIANNAAPAAAGLHSPALQHRVLQPGNDVPFGISPMDPFAAAAARHTTMSMSPMFPSPAVSPAAHRAPDAASYLAAHLASSPGVVSALVPAKRESASESEAEESENDTQARGSVNTIFPRRKQGQHARTNSQPVVLNEATLSQLFTLPLHKAAVKLGISATAMKSACRKLGIKKWPYRALSVTTTKAQRMHRTRSPPGTPTRRALASSASSAGTVEREGREIYPLSDLSQDAMLLAETMRLLQKGFNGAPQDREHDGASSSSSECGSELSGASTREDSRDSRGEDSSGHHEWTTSGAANSVASLLN